MKTVTLNVPLPEKNDVVDFSRKTAGFVLANLSQAFKVAAEVTGNAAKKLLAVEAKSSKKED